MNQPNEIYYDMITTNYKSEKTEPVAINFQENRNIPLLNNSGDYEMSIVRFQVDSQLLPILIPEIESNQSDINKTIYSVSMSYLPDGQTNPIEVQTYITWQPQNKNTIIPPPPSSNSNGLQSDTGSYYYCYNFQWFVSLIYKACLDCFQELQQKTTGLENCIAPVISWNPDNNTAVISAPSDYFNSEDTNAIQLYFNSPLFALFSSFPVQNFGASASLGKNHRIQIANFTGTNTIYLPSIPDENEQQYLCIQVYQEYSTIANWTPANSIVFTSMSLPVYPEQLCSPLVFNEGRQIILGNNSNFANVITDLQTNDLCYKPNLIYNPSAQYRWISLLGDKAISNVDVQVYWKSRFGKLNPLYLMSGSSCSLKILFQKKTKV